MQNIAPRAASDSTGSAPRHAVTSLSNPTVQDVASGHQTITGSNAADTKLGQIHIFISMHIVDILFPDAVIVLKDTQRSESDRDARVGDEEAANDRQEQLSVHEPGAAKRHDDRGESIWQNC